MQRCFLALAKSREKEFLFCKAQLHTEFTLKLLQLVCFMATSIVFYIYCILICGN